MENLILTGNAALNGTGNSFKNTITGNSAANKLYGNGSDDTLDGNAGVDSLYGGTGNDLLKIKDFNGDVIDGGTGNTDVLQISAANQQIDLTAAATSIIGLEGIKFSGAGNNVLTLSAQSILDVSDSDTLTVDGDAGDTLYLDAGWKDSGIQGSYQVYTLSGATVKINTAITDIVMPETTSYIISDAASAEQVSSIFTDSAEEIVVDLGAIPYYQSDLSGGVIDLTGFGPEDTLVLMWHDDSITKSTHGWRTGTVTFYQSTGVVGVHDIVRWNNSAGTVKLGSAGHTGNIQITGLPSGLPDSQFVFV